jgi:hypothetical protein
MKKVALVLVSVVFLTACASTDYVLYAETQKHIASARSAAEIARYQALAEIAKSGNETARVAAVITLNQGTQADSSPRVAAPESTGDKVLKWASVLVPSLTQLYATNKQAEVSVTNSNNNVEIARSSNQTLTSIAGMIQAPGAVTNIDTTHTPTVVTQPAPIIVPSPDPLVITQPAPSIVQ